MAAEIETAILDHALAHPYHGPMRITQELMLRGIQISSGGVRGVWQRHALLTKHDRLLRLDTASATSRRRTPVRWLPSTPSSSAS